MAKSKGKKKTRFSLTPIGLGFVILIVIIVISYLLVSYKSRSPLPFEEVYLYSKQLSRDIHLIDKAISDGFYKIGVPEENIVFPSAVIMDVLPCIRDFAGPTVAPKASPID